jgi:hypothetical protein
MLIKNYYSLTKQELDLFKEFLVSANKESNQPAHSNMNADTLLDILDNTERFKRGCFNILFDDSKIIACSGCYVSNFSSDVLICGSRTWVDKDYRNKQIPREILLPAEKQYAVDNHIKCIALTFNEYNKNLIKLWFRKRLGEDRLPRTALHFGYNGVCVVDHMVTIQHTKQYVIYEMLDPSFVFDWKTII